MESTGFFVAADCSFWPRAVVQRGLSKLGQGIPDTGASPGRKGQAEWSRDTQDPNCPLGSL